MSDGNNKPVRRKRVSYEKQIFDLRQLLEVSKSLNSTIDFNTLIETVLYICMGQMQSLNVGIFLRENFDSDEFVLNSNVKGFEVDPSLKYVIKETHPIIKLFNQQNCCFTMKELEKELGSTEGIDALIALNPLLIVPLKVKNRTNGVLVLAARIADDGERYSKYECEYIMSLSGLVAIAVNNSMLLEMSTTDIMTRLKLKHYFYTVLTDALEKARNLETPICVIMLDIDHFKRFNDTYGHSCGDVVLQNTASIIQKSVRGQDMAARYGGEEFVVMLTNTSVEDARIIGERIRQGIETAEFEYEGQKLSVTISAGVAEYDSNRDASAKAVVDRADAALYVSKQNGRNKVSIAQ